MRRFGFSLFLLASVALGGQASAMPLIPGLPGTTASGTGAPVAPARSSLTMLSPADSNVCALAALAAERSSRIPDQFLVAMGRVESGRRLPGGRFVAWPWTVNAQGKGYVYDTRQEAVDAVRGFQAQGIRSIDVGCLQINLQQHADAFPTIEAAFDPQLNARYAAHFLTDLFQRTGSWPRAAAAYHSFTPDIGTAYQWKVLESWAMPADSGRGPVSAPAVSRVVRHPAPAAPSSGPAVTYASANSAGASLPVQSTFHPGMHGYTPPPSRPAPSGGTGRDLASYRASPVHLVRQAMFVPARF